MKTHTLFYIILIILVVQYIAHQVLDYLNARHFKTPIPPELADVFDEAEYRKAQRYNMANYKFGVFSGSFSLLLILSILLFGGFEWIDQLMRSFTKNPILLAVLFFGFIGLGSSIVNLPFAYYHTFVIEEHYGFNTTTKKLFFLDKLKGGILTVIFGGGILALFILFYQSAGSNFWVYAWILIGVIVLLITFFYSRFIVPLFNKQTPLKEGSLKNAIQSYAQKVGFNLQNIFVIDGSKRSTKSNAYFSGFGKERRVTLFDTLLNDLSEEEIVAVLAHEIGHYKRHHILFNLGISLSVTGFMLYMLSLFINHPQMAWAVGISTPSFYAALAGFALLYNPIAEGVGLMLNYLSRKFEFQADDYAKNTYAATSLITALKKLSKNNLSNLTPHPAYVFVHYAHPPLIERIRNLKE